MDNPDNKKQTGDKLSAPNATGEIPEASVKPLATISRVWFIPIIALLIGAWMVYFSWSNQGPLINIAFETAEGVEVDTTKIKLRDITVGTVVDLKLNDDFDGIIITARMNKNTERLLKQDTKFWVVKPRVGKGGFSGLSTILSGAYIELSPGASGVKGRARFEFVGLERPPVTPVGTPGLHITLDSSGQRAMDIGDPILFRGIQVGQIEYVHFNHDERIVYYNAFIESPYDDLITTNTRFWEVKGIAVDMSADGIRLETGTLETFLRGGVTFDVPSNLPRGEVITERAFFTIYPNQEEIYDKQYKVAEEFVLLFGESIRGLRPGAPVEYKGVRVGSVSRTDIDYPDVGNLLDKHTLIPVLIRIEPARLGLSDDEEDLVQVRENLSRWVTDGLHGFLSTGNLLTGSKYIELRYIDDATTSMQTFSKVQVIPTAASEIDRLLEKIGSITSAIEELPLGQLIDNFNEALLEMDKAMIKFASASGRFDNFLSGAESERMIANVNQTLNGIEQLAKDFSEGSKTHQDIQSTIAALDRVLRELAPVLSQMNRQPNSLIFSSAKESEVEPKGKNNEK